MISEQSANFNDVVKDRLAPLVKAKVDSARLRLETDIYKELVTTCDFAPTQEDIKRIIDGLPDDVFTREMIART